MLYILYEAGIALGAVAAALEVQRHVPALDRRLVESALLALALKIYAGGILALAFTAAGLNSAWSYLGAAGAVTVAAGVWTFRRWNRDRTPMRLPSWRPLPLRRLLPWALLGLLGPVLLANIRPPSHPDAITLLNSVRAWAANAAGPYDGGVGVNFWELGYLVPLRIANSDGYWWWISLQAVALVGTAGAALAGRLRLPPVLTALAVVNGLAVYHYWFLPGLFGIKSDVLVAAGLLMLALGMLRLHQGVSTPYVYLSIALGATFLGAKYFGPPALVAMLAVFAVLHVRRRGLSGWLLKGGLLAVAVSLPATLHFYVHNTLKHGNPVFPSELTLGFLHFAGKKVLGGTSVLSGMGEPELWSGLVSTDQLIHPAGALFVPVLVGTVAGLIWSGFRALRRRQVDSSVLCFALLAAVWGCYAASHLGAGTIGPDGQLTFVYIRWMRSLRYALAPLLLAEIVLLAAMSRRVQLQWFAYLAVTVSLLSRLYLLATGGFFGGQASIFASDDAMWLYVGTSLIGTGLVVTLVWRFPLVRRPSVLVSAFAIAGLALSPVVYEENRAALLSGKWRFAPLSRLLVDEPASTIFLLSETHGERLIMLGPAWYAVAGNRLQHRVRIGPEAALQRGLSSGREPHYVAAMSGRAGFSAAEWRHVSTILEGHGYQAVLRNGWSGLWARNTSRNSGDADELGWGGWRDWAATEAQ